MLSASRFRLESKHLLHRKSNVSYERANDFNRVFPQHDWFWSYLSFLFAGTVAGIRDQEPEAFAGVMENRIMGGEWIAGFGQTQGMVRAVAMLTWLSAKP